MQVDTFRNAGTPRREPLRPIKDLGILSHHDQVEQHTDGRRAVHNLDEPGIGQIVDGKKDVPQVVL